ncbi:MAG: HAMP domain-containing protein [Methylotenera sp.]|nr:HAMP domain-containing protein [Oligoflexia bacterium]
MSNSDQIVKNGELRGLPPLDTRERRKRRREGIAIILLSVLFIALTVAEFRLSKVSSTLPFVNSIFFFGLLNINIVILIALVWLVFRNIGKLFIERRNKILGARLKTKLVISFLAFSIIPTLVLFIISAAYINSSFDKWFSIKIQNTLQASLEITSIYYRNADQTAAHFAEHIAKGIGTRMRAEGIPEAAVNRTPTWIGPYLESQRDLLALDAAEYYADSLDERVLVRRSATDIPIGYPRLPLDLLDRAFSGENVPVIQHVGSGDLIRSLAPIRLVSGGPISGVVVVDKYIPVSLVNKVDEIASVIDDYKDTNPLKYPMKTAYFIILVMITLVILFVAMWIGLYMAKELTVPVERLVYGAQAVGAGNLDVTILGSGHDEIAVLVESFNKMTKDLRDNRASLTMASADLEKRRLQLEAVLANVGTGVIVVDSEGQITTFNRAIGQILELVPEQVLGKSYMALLQGESAPLVEAIGRALGLPSEGPRQPEISQWNFRTGDNMKALSAVASPLMDATGKIPWGAVAVIDDMTYLIKGQREMAWREVARRIAHEIKNPLTPIKLSAQRLQRRLGHYPGKDALLLKECTDTIIRHTDELKEMVNEFSNFARFPEASPAPHDLNDACKEVVSLYQQAHSDIQFKFETEPRLPIFEFDRDQLKRVLINLLDNAAAVFKSTGRETPKIVEIRIHFHLELQMAVIVVKDNGPGMTDDVKARVFEPYFSTKSEGTGLGLAIAKRIVNDHDGFIRVHSAPGEGTEFLIELPTAVRHGLDRKPSRL